MIAVVIGEDGQHFRVMEHKEGHVIDVTEEYCIHPMSIHVDGVDIVGFHVGQVKATAETTG